MRLYHLHPRIIRLDAAYWSLRLIAWIHETLHATTVIPWNPKRQKNRSCLPPTWTAQEFGKHSSIERFSGRVFLLLPPATSTARALVGRHLPTDDQAHLSLSTLQPDAHLGGLRPCAVPSPLREVEPG